VLVGSVERWVAKSKIIPRNLHTSDGYNTGRAGERMNLDRRQRWLMRPQWRKGDGMDNGSCGSSAEYRS
jgi:hypothetical protein